MTVDLFHRRSGQGPTIVLLHGLFGSSDNWGTVARALSERFDVVLADLRDHGRSPHTEATDYTLMAADVLALFDRLGLQQAVLAGHSMGGKTAMTFAQQWPERLRALVVVDIGPREYPLGQHAVIAEALRTSDLAHKTGRQQVEEHLARTIPEAGVVQFLLKSLYWKQPGELCWRFNVPTLLRCLPAIHGGIAPHTVRTPTLFIRGGMSPYIIREDLPQIQEQFPGCRVETIPYAGHWVPAQAPEETVALIREVAD
jgi:esterase